MASCRDPAALDVKLVDPLEFDHGSQRLTRVRRAPAFDVFDQKVTVTPPSTVSPGPWRTCSGRDDEASHEPLSFTVAFGYGSP